MNSATECQIAKKQERSGKHLPPQPMYSKGVQQGGSLWPLNIWDSPLPGEGLQWMDKAHQSYTAILK